MENEFAIHMCTHRKCRSIDGEPRSLKRGSQIRDTKARYSNRKGNEQKKTKKRNSKMKKETRNNNAYVLYIYLAADRSNTCSVFNRLGKVFLSNRWKITFNSQFHVRI